MCCPRLFKNSSDVKGLNYINDYLDIKYIIARLQDIDKLKRVLLTKKQRKIFETIPKPLINCNSENIKKEGSIYMEDMTKEKEKKSPKIKKSWKSKIKKYQFILNEDPVNQRLSILMDPELKMILKSLPITNTKEITLTMPNTNDQKNQLLLESEEINQITKISKEKCI